MWQKQFIEWPSFLERLMSGLRGLSITTLPATCFRHCPSWNRIFCPKTCHRNTWWWHMVNMEKPDRSQVASLIWSEICQICLKLAIVMFCARNFKTGNCSPGVSFRLGHTLWNRVDSGEKCLQRWNVKVKSVYKHKKIFILAAMSTPLCAQIAYRPSAALQQLALHNHLEQTMLGQCPHQHSQICSL